MRDADHILDDVGGFGRYQIMLTVWCSLCSLLCGMHVMGNFFITIEPIGECPCGEDVCTEPCTNPGGDWCLNTTRAFSLPIEFKGCDPPGWAGPTVPSTFFFGWFFGGLICGRLSDKIGRCRLSFVLLIVGSAVYFAGTFTKSLEMYYGFSALRGFNVGGLTLTSYVLGVEMIHSKHACYVGSAVLGAFAVGCVFLVPLAYLLPDWKDFCRLISCFSLPLLLFYPFLHESTRWLASSGEDDRAIEIYKKIAKVNGVAYSGEGGEESPQEAGRPPVEAVAFRELFSFPEIRRRTLVMLISWFTVALTYYGLNFAAGDLGGDLYMNAAVIAAVELPTYILQGWAVEYKYLGRKRTGVGSFVVAAVCCALFPLLRAMGMDVLAKLFAFAGKFAITSAFSVVYIWAADLFPTDIRVSGMGACTAVARVGALIAAYVAKASTTGALAGFGTLSAICAVLCLSLPETQGAEPPDTLEELRRGMTRHATLESASSMSSLNAINEEGNLQDIDILSEEEPTAC